MADSRPQGSTSSSKAGADPLAGKSTPPPRTSRAAGPNAMRVRSVDKGEPSPTEDELDAREARQAGRKRKAPGPTRDASKRPKPTAPVDGPPPTDPQ
jgi:hypothetical protein